jgi:hypothetical protein
MNLLFSHSTTFPSQGTGLNSGQHSSSMIISSLTDFPADVYDGDPVLIFLQA